MFNWIVNISLLLIAGGDAYFAYYKLTGLWQLTFIFLAGLLFGMFLMNIKLIVKDKKLGTYKRQLEKESVTSDENAAKVKVLEQKIDVLEKALDNALNKS